MNHISDPNLVLYLPLHKGDGSPFASEDAYGHLCLAVGASWRPAGRYFDKTDDYIDCGSSGVLKPVTALTVEAWIKPSSVTGYQDIVSSQVGGASGYYLEMVNANLSFGYAPMSTTTTANNPLSTGSYQHVVATFETSGGNTVRLYLNSGQVKAANPAGTPAASTVKLYLGRYASSNTQNYGGIIGEVRLYSRALSPAEIQHNYLATKWRYR